MPNRIRACQAHFGDDAVRDRSSAVGREDDRLVTTGREVGERVPVAGLQHETTDLQFILRADELLGPRRAEEHDRGEDQRRRRNDAGDHRDPVVALMAVEHGRVRGRELADRGPERPANSFPTRLEIIGERRGEADRHDGRDDESTNEHQQRPQPRTSSDSRREGAASLPEQDAEDEAGPAFEDRQAQPNPIGGAVDRDLAALPGQQVDGDEQAKENRDELEHEDDDPQCEPDPSAERVSENEQQDDGEQACVGGDVDQTEYLVDPLRPSSVDHDADQRPEGRERDDAGSPDRHGLLPPAGALGLGWLVDRRLGCDAGGGHHAILLANGPHTRCREALSPPVRAITYGLILKGKISRLSNVPPGDEDKRHRTVVTDG